ncbi:acyl carrier protein [Candidatus Leptofilum sp.]|uniref:acyl carrier protein n=1 Tax=Candidatus Leptofilum sp. TaxID=3241576 RepID=UPI003B59427B
MPEKNQFQDQLLSFIRTKFVNNRPEQSVDLTANFDLLISGLVDSHGVLRIAAFMEKTFQIKIPPRDIIIEHFRSVDAMTQYLEKRLT